MSANELMNTAEPNNGGIEKVSLFAKHNMIEIYRYTTYLAILGLSFFCWEYGRPNTSEFNQIFTKQSILAIYDILIKKRL